MCIPTYVVGVAVVVVVAFFFCVQVGGGSTLLLGQVPATGVASPVGRAYRHRHGRTGKLVFFPFGDAL